MKSFESIALSVREAEIISRRTSLTGLGGAALAALALGARTEAKKGKKRRKKGKNNGEDQCLRQKEQCYAAVVEACDERPQPVACRERFLDCCEPFEDCDSERAAYCFFTGNLP